ncbi:hypothetical protein EDC50_0453 [Vulcaniibacterium tengchongense]|uniref:Uncharacterized protein n=1 Tax=Vulcaniibacterium tengchongense TaxID=1273429 RepID=A0A3N4VF31_9GAMM|nr:hypothetical protein EDC50_0453 [Vulcaniibacterium tengchongense]
MTVSVARVPARGQRARADTAALRPFLRRPPVSVSPCLAGGTRTAPSFVRIERA